MHLIYLSGALTVQPPSLDCIESVRRRRFHLGEPIIGIGIDTVLPLLNGNGGLPLILFNALSDDTPILSLQSSKCVLKSAVEQLLSSTLLFHERSSLDLPRRNDLRSLSTRRV